MNSARLRRDAAARPARLPAARAQTKSRSSRLTFTGSRACGAWPEPSSVTSSPPVSSASAAPAPAGGPRPRRRGSRAPGSGRARRAPARSPRRIVPPCVAISVSGSVSSPQPTQSSICLVECGSVKHCAKKNSRNRGSRAASSGGCTWPSPRRCRAPRRTRSRPCRGVWAASGTAGPMKTTPVDALRMLGGEQQRRAAPPTRARPRRPRSVAVASRTARASAANSALGVRLGALRPVRAPVAAPVEGDHAEVARQVRDLRLPAARVDDRPGRQQQDGRLAAAVDLVEDPHAVALDEALAVRVAGRGVSALAPDPWPIVAASTAAPRTRG